MNHKVFRSVFVVAVALGCASVVARIKDEPAVRPSSSAKDSHADPLSRPLASYRVYEEPGDGGIDYRGANFKARVSEDGSYFGAVPPAGAIWATPEFKVEFGTPRIEQGAFKLECARGRFVRPAFGVAQLDRGAVTEEYLFENRRVEQIFRFPVSLGEGALRLAIPVKSDLTGPVTAYAPNQEGWHDLQFQKGGLAFADASGETRLAYHSAVAIDAGGQEIALAPRHENGEIILEVPADFMARAKYPVVIDPWLDFTGSGSGGGVSQNGSTSENPVFVLQGSQPFIAWADNSAAGSSPTNTDIYLKWWNGFEFKDLGGSTSPGGLSKTPGKSVNPTLAFSARGTMVLAWEDDTTGNVGVYLKVWPVKGDAGSGAWTELDGSASGGGLCSTFTPCQHPSVGGMFGVIPGTVTTNSSTGVTTSTPPTPVDCPVVAFDNPYSGTKQIYCYVFYPGAPAQPVSQTFPLGLPAVAAGWYQMGRPGGAFVSKNTIDPFSTISKAPQGATAEYPSLVVDSQNRVAIAWQDSRSGNYEIYFRCLTYNPAPPPSTVFQIAPPNNANSLIELDMLPAGDFAEFAGSASAGGVSGMGTRAQFPALSTDLTGLIDNYTIAWQQAESVAVNPAVSTQIYLARSTGAGFGGVGSSMLAGGISQTLSHAVNPSVDVNGGYIGVAWADDSNSKSSIYIRRMFLGIGGSGLWEQVGFQGSAFPAQGGELNAPIGGISQSFNFAIQPKIKLDAFGSPTVVWADGSAATFDIRAKVFSPNGPGIATGVGTTNPVFTTSLRQTLTDPSAGPATDVPVSGFAAGTSVFLSSRVFTELLNPPGTSLLLELEIQPVGSPFTNSANFQTLYVAPDDPNVTPTNLAVFKFDGLPNTNYYWQARTSDRSGRTSPWIQAPVDSGGVSFRINLAAPPGSGGSGNGPANTGSTVTTGATKSKCGLTGLEAIALLGALRLLRRRRSK